MNRVGTFNEALTIFFVAIFLIGVVITIKVYLNKKKEKVQKQVQLIKEFKNFIPKLADNFGSIWLISKGKSKNPERVFCILGKIFKYSENAVILNWWQSFSKGYEVWNESTYREISNVFLVLLNECGLVCGDIQVKAPENYEELYTYTEDVFTGIAIEVVMPYWYYEGRIIEMGFIKVLKESKL